ncbi:hypothetical protein LPJ77_003520 [Coemansia sp. RSA 2523]|nr:hypothetical protein LPJ54_003150 [Coemansia sp. RSA 1824]KAJ1806605.1 hypothetical protein LPJ77_003520 [Coemansia sp. RSA 2523]KAJ2141172.1 hypothetical protein IW142_005007 [Coemansia sp. RSA 564]KAJ2189746.1 hypothetical protein EV181_001442 [Coemansia sp. RSA 532]KAJ2228752.1 hypothetical protein EV180_001840 [Coemansia sp. RSA 518]KAJ2277183.1 hypothetical protein J3F81_001056 [Coemansia sp. RSA 371]KAJ2291486.1 hypothetical protein IW141_002628 [Coemansia sp. RSA 355]KAJ2298960.1 h
MESHEQFSSTLSYVATCMSMLCGGTTSLFATYGSSFGEVLGFTQYETNMVASLGDYAHYMSAPLFGYLTLRIGPRRVTQAAGVLMFVGYMGLSYAFDRLPTQRNQASHYVATMSLLFALVGVGSKAAYMAAMATTASNFRHSRFAGIALGVPLSLYGLSTFVFSSVKAHWFERDAGPARYLLCMAVVSLIAHLLASGFVKLRDSAQLAVVGAKRRRAQSAPRAGAKGVKGDDAGVDQSSSAEAIEMTETRRRRMTTSDPDGETSSPELRRGSLDLTQSTPARPEPTPAEPPIFQRFSRDPTAWALLLGLICFSGPGLAFVNNCGTMVRAMAHTTTMSEEQIGQYKDRIVATQSFFSFASRLSVGYFSDVWRTKLRLPRAGLLVLAAVLMIYAQQMAAQVARLDDLRTLAVLIGVAMGSAFTLAPTITAETWGAHNFGICWGVITLGPAIGGHVCNLVFGFSWDEGLARIAAHMSPIDSDRVHCDSSCFAPAFVTNTKIAYAGLAFFAAVLLMPRILHVLGRKN